MSSRRGVRRGGGYDGGVRVLGMRWVGLAAFAAGAVALGGCGSVTEDPASCERRAEEYEKSWFIGELSTPDDDPWFETTIEIVGVDGPVQPVLAATSRTFPTLFELAVTLLIARDRSDSDGPDAVPVGVVKTAFFVSHHREPCGEERPPPVCGFEDINDDCYWYALPWFGSDLSFNAVESPPRFDHAAESSHASDVKYTPVLLPPELRQIEHDANRLSTIVQTKVEWSTPEACVYDFPTLAPGEACPAVVLTQRIRFERRP